MISRKEKAEPKFAWSEQSVAHLIHVIHSILFSCVAYLFHQIIEFPTMKKNPLYFFSE